MNIVHLGDCINIMKTISDKSIDLTVTSPPYDNLRNYNKSLLWNEDIWKTVISDLFRITKIGGIVVWVVRDATINGSETGTSFKQALYFKEVGFNLHDTMIYETNGNPYPESNRYYQSFEYMFIFSVGKPKTVNLINDRENKYFGQKIARKRAGRNADGIVVANSASRLDPERTIKKFGVRYNIWRINSKQKTDSYGHPAIFPEMLVHDHILTWSNEGDTIFDPFAGSGTVGKVAKSLNRNYILIEKVEHYYKNIIKRLDDK